MCSQKLLQNHHWFDGCLSVTWACVKGCCLMLWCIKCQVTKAFKLGIKWELWIQLWEKLWGQACSLSICSLYVQACVCARAHTVYWRLFGGVLKCQFCNFECQAELFNMIYCSKIILHFSCCTLLPLSKILPFSPDLLKSHNAKSRISLFSLLSENKAKQHWLCTSTHSFWI